MRMSRSVLSKAAFVGLVATWCTGAMAQNHPPATPVITEPREGRIINPADLHMETGPFSDPDAGDTHLCSDWEVWQVSPSVRVWITSCIGGVERVHTHLGDGTFEGPLAGRNSLASDTQYELRTRHRDSSNDPATEWSPRAVRAFRTGPITQVFPLEVEDALTAPVPTLREVTGGSVTLPGGVTPASVRVESATGQSLFEFRGRTAQSPQLFNPPPLAAHANVRAAIASGGSGLILADCNLQFTDEDGRQRDVFLPALTLGPGQTALFWISDNGSTYVAQPGETEPQFGTLARGAAVPWSIAPGYRVEVVATGFQLPVNIAFVPNPGSNPTDPFYYVNELYGTIKVVARNGQISNYATNLLNFNPTGNFPGSGEQGLTGLCIDPATGDLFATMLYSSVTGNEAAPHYPKVVRFQSTDGGRTAATQTIIRNMVGETMGQSHQISNISFGPDGLLYVHVGDGFDAARSQDINSYRGKILRMTTTGAAVADNPLYNASNGITATDYIYAYGLRNPFGGGWRISDGAHYTVENGPSVDRFSRLVRGRNYGYTGSDASMRTFALYNWDPSAAPVNIAFIQQGTFGGSGFPAEKLDHAYVTESGATWGEGPQGLGKKITEWEIDAQGNLVQGPRVVASYTGSGRATAAALAAGPDGLYFSDLYKDQDYQSPIDRGANILRIRYVGAADCNSNGVPDDQDIAAGTSRDCNGNSIPDECDIGSGRSQDCNNNGVPDECDTTTVVLYDFGSNTPAPFQLNGAAAMAGGFVRLTPAQGGLQGSMVRPALSGTPMERLSVGFDFRIGGGSGADGFSFAAMDSSRFNLSTSFGEEGPGVGSLVVQFDTYDNGGEGENTIEAMYNNVTLARYTPTFDLEDDQRHHATITFGPTGLTVRVSPAPGQIETAFENLEVPGFTPFVALFGFGGRTGGLTNEHDIDNVSFGVPGPGDADGDGVPDECAFCAADFNSDGGVDGGDVEAFYAAWENAEPLSDVNRDGGIDGADVEAFFTVWQNGGC